MMISMVQFAVFFIILISLAWPLGKYIARVMNDEKMKSDRLFSPIENAIYKILGVSQKEEMRSKEYTIAVVLFSLFGFLFLFLMQLLQQLLPLNPQGFSGVKWDLAFNTAVSFITNTNWQAYSGESSMSYFTQLAGLTVQNFVSAATGIAVLFAILRGFSRVQSTTIGNFWRDITKVTLRVLLPLSVIVALVLVSQGTIQTLSDYVSVNLMESVQSTEGVTVSSQVLPMGPAASQIAIKFLGTNGGGFFGANSAHPFENPTPLSNFLQILSMLIIPAALCFSMGSMIKDRRQGNAILITMMILFITALALVHGFEQFGAPALGIEKDVDLSTTQWQSGGNMEGKETRFGIAGSSLFITATTAASCGGINSQHDSLTPLGGMVPLILMQFGEVVFGGVGSGLYGMIAFVIVAVFVSGLMVGRTPEYLGKKIEPFEMKMASLIVLIPPVTVLITTAIAVVVPTIVASLNNSGPHGFTEVLYAFTSAGNNNGSAFNGFGANHVYLNLMLAFAMLMGRFACMLAAIAIAGSLANKKHIPETSGTLVTYNGMFIGLLIAVIVMVGALSFFPALALGPIAEQLQFIAK